MVGFLVKEPSNTTMDETQAKNHHDGEGGSQAPEECRFTKATVARVMRHATPPNSKVANDAKEAVHECVAEFNAIVIQAAAEECKRDRRLTVNGDDIILAMRNLGFEDYVGPLTEYLRRYRESEGITMPRSRRSTMAPPPALAAPAVEAAPPSPKTGLALQLCPPAPRDVTELGLHTDVYAVRRGGAPAGTG